nr:zeta toxin family protein [Streptomyces sp. BK022]
MDSDLYKPYHPQYAQLMAQDDRLMTLYTGPDGRAWMRQAQQFVRGEDPLSNGQKLNALVQEIAMGDGGDEGLLVPRLHAGGVAAQRGRAFDEGPEREGFRCGEPSGGISRPGTAPARTRATAAPTRSAPGPTGIRCACSNCNAAATGRSTGAASAHCPRPPRSLPTRSAPACSTRTPRHGRRIRLTTTNSSWSARTDTSDCAPGTQPPSPRTWPP